MLYLKMTDEILIQRALQGHQQAYAAILGKYENYVFTLCLRIVKNREEAHEVTQDTFLKAFRSLHTFREEAKLSTWLYKIAYSTSLNHLRKKRPEILSLDDSEKPVMIAETSSNGSIEIEKKEYQALLQKAITQLSPDDAAVITLFYLLEQRVDDICKTMELTETNVKTKLFRARQRLKVIIEKDFCELTQAYQI